MTGPPSLQCAAPASNPASAAPHLWYADASVVVVEKPAGLLAVPGRGEAGLDHLAGRVQAVHADALVVHRLDMATSGLIVFARGATAQRLMSTAFAERQVDKRYVAVVEGELTADEGSIDAPLEADWPRRPRQRVDPVAGKPSVTHWRVLARGSGWTRVELQPITGRSHQLRVHLQHIGHPVRGDALYAPPPLKAGRLLLHARSLSFVHPVDGRRLTFTSEPAF